MPGDTAGPREGQWQPGWHTRAAHKLWPGLQDKPCPRDAACGCAPACCMLWGARESRACPPSTWGRQHGQRWQPGDTWGAEEVPGSHPHPSPLPHPHTHTPSHWGSAWVISSIALFISVQQEKRLTVALKE